MLLRRTPTVLGKNVPLVGSLLTAREKAEVITYELTNAAVFKRTIRDAFYLFIDTWKEVKLAHKSYGDFHAYIRARAGGKELTEDRMDNLDLEIMRRQLNMYHAAKSPLTWFDLRWFYYMYAVWFVVLLHGGWQAYQRKQTYQQMLGGNDDELTIEQRRKRFGGSYVEDVRKDWVN